jgi:hypothetical protein
MALVNACAAPAAPFGADSRGMGHRPAGREQGRAFRRLDPPAVRTRRRQESRQVAECPQCGIARAARGGALSELPLRLRREPPRAQMIGSVASRGGGPDGTGKPKPNAVAYYVQSPRTRGTWRLRNVSSRHGETIKASHGTLPAHGAGCTSASADPGDTTPCAPDAGDQS